MVESLTAAPQRSVSRRNRRPNVSPQDRGADGPKLEKVHVALNQVFMFAEQHVRASVGPRVCRLHSTWLSGEEIQSPEQTLILAYRTANGAVHLGVIHVAKSLTRIGLFAQQQKPAWPEYAIDFSSSWLHDGVNQMLENGEREYEVHGCRRQRQLGQRLHLHKLDVGDEA